MRSWGNACDYFRNGYGKEGGAERPHTLGEPFGTADTWVFCGPHVHHTRQQGLSHLARPCPGRTSCWMEETRKQEGEGSLAVEGAGNEEIGSAHHQTHLMREPACERLPHSRANRRSERDRKATATSREEDRATADTEPSASLSTVPRKLVHYSLRSQTSPPKRCQDPD